MCVSVYMGVTGSQVHCRHNMDSLIKVRTTNMAMEVILFIAHTNYYANSGRS